MLNRTILVALVVSLGLTLGAPAVWAQGGGASSTGSMTGKVTDLKSWIDYVGKDHMHHRLERILGSRRASVAMVFAVTICLGLAAIVLRKANTAEAIMLLAQATLIVVIITILEHRGRPVGANTGRDMQGKGL